MSRSNTTNNAMLKFKHPTIQEAYLLNASSETVYDWIKNTAEHTTTDFSDAFPEGLVAKLRQRDDPLINLAIAEFTTDPDILKDLFNSKDNAVRVAVLANSFRDAGFGAVFNYQKWISEEQFKQLCTSKSREEICAYFTNRRLGGGRLAEVYLRKGVYTEVSDDQYLLILFYALKNPNVSLPHEHDRFALDGWDEYEESKPRHAAWTLLDTLDNTEPIASLLSQAYEHIPFELPFSETNDLPHASKKYESERDRVTVAFLSRIFERWNVKASGEDKALDLGKRDFSSFQTLRETIASAVPYYSSAAEFLRKHDDIYVRRGFYRSFHPSGPDELEELFDKDGKHFIEAAVYNKALYKRDPREIRSKLYELIWEKSQKLQDMEFEDRQLLKRYSFTPHPFEA